LLVHITAATLGISAILYHSPLIFSIIKYAGAAYLLYLAYKSFTDKGTTIQLEAGESLSQKALYQRGIIMNLLNPKVALFFLAFFPQFVNDQAGHVPLQMLVFGFLFLAQTLVIFLLISVFAGKVGGYLRKKPAISRRINLVQGTLFTLIGLNLAFSENT
jgi:threonine/homoserine/homoserine lactone efflux protein